ncbi:TPA: terminase large subunit, partial [Pseudomonas aeruginosa]|nr:terminase large subunit [Pseudomonas aeruginosa]
MIRNKYVDEYIQQWRDGKIVFNQERIDLIEYLEKDVLTLSTVHFEEEKIEKCIKFIEKWYFPTQPF